LPAAGYLRTISRFTSAPSPCADRLPQRVAKFKSLETGVPYFAPHPWFTATWASGERAAKIPPVSASASRSGPKIVLPVKVARLHQLMPYVPGRCTPRRLTPNPRSVKLAHCAKRGRRRRREPISAGKCPPPWRMSFTRRPTVFGQCRGNGCAQAKTDPQSRATYIRAPSHTVNCRVVWMRHSPDRGSITSPSSGNPTSRRIGNLIVFIAKVFNP